MTPEERAHIAKAVAIRNSTCNDGNEIVFKPWQLCGFTPMNIPIIAGMVLSSPTMFNTLLFGWMNQSYNAGMNFGNRNSTCVYGADDMMRGYCVAVGSALSVSFGIRKATANLTKGATGTKVMILNTIV